MADWTVHFEMHVAIIGSAGRKDDAQYVNLSTFQWIVDQVKELTLPEDTLISGGAAYSDHSAVVVALERDQPLILELPAQWNDQTQQFVETEAGRISNYYHRNFSKACGWPENRSLQEIDQAIKRSKTKIKVVDGFFQRNSLIADQCEKLLAFTFHDPGPNGPSGGTGNTWRKCKAPKQCFKIPIDQPMETNLDWPDPSSDLMQKVDQEYAIATVYPPRDQIFTALKLCPLQSVKVVILGQDCYHGPNQAHGLAFSVASGKAPPSLVNIFAELNADLGIKRTEANLSDWASQGVLLLNAMLTVRAGQPASHAQLGWQAYTDQLIKLANDRPHVVFMLWGNFAKQKNRFIDHRKHLILTAGHPSPLSVKLFQGCKHFSKCNEWLSDHQLDPIKW